jgi:hypothetical protein
MTPETSRLSLGARRSRASGNLPSVTTVLALTAGKATFGLVVVFFVIFPVLVQGLIAFAIAQSLGERQENLEYLEGRQGPSQG